MTYAGCANWITWNIGLYMGNDYYHGTIDFLSELDHLATEEDARRYFEEVMGGQTPDGFGESTGERRQDIDFGEVADDLRGFQHSYVGENN